MDAREPQTQTEKSKPVTTLRKCNRVFYFSNEKSSLGINSSLKSWSIPCGRFIYKNDKESLLYNIRVRFIPSNFGIRSTSSILDIYAIDSCIWIYCLNLDHWSEIGMTHLSYLCFLLWDGFYLNFLVFPPLNQKTSI